MRAHISESSKKNEIRMLLKHPRYHGAVIVLVEGGSDFRLFRKLFDANKVSLTSVMGKGPLERMVDELFRESRRVYGLRDADHDRLIDEDVGSDCIFVTDEHDAELMMIRSGAFEHVVAEFSAGEEFYRKYSELRSSLFNSAYEIGVLRYLSEVNGWNINFKALTFTEFVNVVEYDISVDTGILVEQALARSDQCPVSLSHREVLAQRDAIGWVHPEVQICCGHDVTKIMEIVYSQREVAIEGNISQSRIESSLRLSFDIDMFSATGLYHRVSDALGFLGTVFAPKDQEDRTYNA